MPQNAASPDTHDIPLSLWGGLVTNMSPTALPMGVSPSCSDVSFLPGGVSQRPCFKKVFANPIYPNNSITYGKSFVAPDGIIRNLYFYDNGALTIEDVTTAPGVETLLSQTSAVGCYAKSITAFGREYIAISDGLHGQEIPLQYDGTFLDRISQDGPGASPNVISLVIPSSQMPSSSSPPATLTITGIFPTASNGTFFTILGIFLTAPPTGVSIGQAVTVAGTPFDGTYTVIALPSDGSVQVSAYTPVGTPAYVGAGTLTVGSGIPNVTMVRQNNIVTVPTATPHNLQVGYLAQISGVSAGVVGGTIASVTINNEDSPGVATVVTTAPHGLVPGVSVSLQGIVASAIGGGISSISRTGGVVTAKMTTGTGLAPGGVVAVAGVSDVSFNGLATVVNVTTTSNPGDTFTYVQPYSVDATSSGGTVGLTWPVAQTQTPSYFTVTAAPEPDTFQIQVYYPDGSWTGGTVSYAWDGKFFVKTVINPNTFQYLQYGPDATTTDVGTVTPYGQAAPGVHQMQVFFITRQGYTTAPSPPVQFTANGGQYISVSNIPIGPPNITARALAFTGAKGAYFFYIPSPPQVNGQIVGTATQINDNVTTSVILDFGDNTLFAALGISIPGNNLANETVIDSALGFGFYGSRLFTYGQRNKVTGLLNMGFDGGYLPNNPTVPTGWNLNPASPGGSLQNGHYGQGWQIAITPGGTFCGLISQSFYEDYSGAPIGQSKTKYRVRLWAQSNIPVGDAGITVSLSSFGATFASFASITGITTAGSFIEADFSLPTPNAVYADMLLSIYGTATSTAGVVITVDEVSIIYVERPYRTGAFASYVNNPEAFDGVSGVIGPVDDTHQMMDLGIIRSNLYMLTQDPSGRLHETSQGTGEPASWTVNEVAASCGTVSAFSLTHSQADDSTAADEEFFAWYSSTGIRVFGGDSPDKISQEIQRPIGQTFPGAPADLGALNKGAQLTVWGLNDPQQKIMWFGIPTGTATAPNVIYQLSYIGMGTAGAIAAGAPVHRGLSGKMTASDLGRKWTPWQRAMNGGALMYRDTSSLEPVFFSGDARAPGVPGGEPVYTQDIIAATSVSIAESTHKAGIEPYVIAIDSVGDVQDVSIVNAVVLGIPTGNFTIGFGSAFTGTVAIGQGGTYAQAVTGVTSVIIPKATHGQGTTPYVIAIDNIGNFLYPSVINATAAGIPTGNLTIGFLPAFTGVIVVGSGTSYVQAVNSISSISIPSATHNQGTTPYVIAVDPAGNFVSPQIVNAIVGTAPSGNLTLTFNPRFSGTVIVGSGGGIAPTGNAYTLSAGQYTDDDFGRIFPFYSTFAFPDRDQEQQMQLGGYMKMVAYTGTFITGIGAVAIEILYETLANAWPLVGNYPLQQIPLFDLEWSGGNAQGQRFFFKYSFGPNGGTDVAFSLTWLVVSLKKAKRMPVRGLYP